MLRLLSDLGWLYWSCHGSRLELGICSSHGKSWFWIIIWEITKKSQGQNICPLSKNGHGDKTLTQETFWGRLRSTLRRLWCVLWLDTSAARWQQAAVWFLGLVKIIRLTLLTLRSKREHPWGTSSSWRAPSSGCWGCWRRSSRGRWVSPRIM